MKISVCVTELYMCTIYYGQQLKLISYSANSFVKFAFS